MNIARFRCSEHRKLQPIPLLSPKEHENANKDKDSASAEGRGKMEEKGRRLRT